MEGNVNKLSICTTIVKKIYKNIQSNIITSIKVFNLSTHNFKNLINKNI